MKGSLLFKLLTAFLLVIAIGAMVMAFLTSRSTEQAFTLYTTRNSKAWAETLSPTLVEYYSQANSWQGVDAYLLTLGGSMTMGSGGMMGQGKGYGKGVGSGGTTVMAADQRLILADTNGAVIADTQGTLTGSTLDATDLANGVSLINGNSLVGTLIVTPGNFTAGTPASDFLTSVNKAIASSTGIAAVIALIFGAVLFFQIISPIRKLNKAAAAIAAGDLDQRVSIQSRDELGALGDSFNKMAQSLSKAETQRKNMIADVAHELRTPLASMQGTLEGIQDGLLPLDREQVDLLLADTTLLTRLVGDLRLLSLADSGELALEKRAVSPAALFEQIVEHGKTIAHARQINLSLELQSHLPAIWADPDRITQLVNNLITNAVHYTPAGGEIKISVDRIVGVNALQVSVTDTGPGIERADLPYVFDRFYRVEKSRSRSSGGSGLGLAIVKQLVEAHGGQVGAESPVFSRADGSTYGTRIHFSLPIQAEP